MDIIGSRDELCNVDTSVCSLFTLNGEIHLAKVIDCYDGDTFHCVFKYNGKYQKFIVRMLGYDSPEMKPSKKHDEVIRQKIKELAVVSRDKLRELILGKIIYLYTQKFDNFGRLLAIVKLNVDDEKTINDMMVEGGYGVCYFGGKKDELAMLEE